MAESSCKHKASVKYDDPVRIVTRINYVKTSSLEFGYEVFCDKKLIATGSTVHVFVNKAQRPTRVPKEVLTVLKQ